jgi:predicted RNase H-like HicB family nuclease
MRYPMAIEIGDDKTAYDVIVPDLPGCFSAGDMAGKSPRYTEQQIIDYLAAREMLVARAAEPSPRPTQRGPKRSSVEPNPLLLAQQILKARREGR